MSQSHAPVCLTCKVEMKWSRAAIAQKTPLVLKHVYYCPTCGNIGHTHATPGEAPEMVSFFGRSNFFMPPAKEAKKERGLLEPA